MAPRALKTVLVLGSTRAKRAGPKVAQAVIGRIQARRDTLSVGATANCAGGAAVDKPAISHDIQILDPRETENGFFLRMMEKAHFHYRQGEVCPPELERTAAIVRAADCFVIVAPEMNHVCAPGVVNLMSYFGANAYGYKPSGLVTYSAGRWGGSRAGVALRTFVGELGCVAVSATCQVPHAWKSDGSVFADDGDSGDGGGSASFVAGSQPEGSCDRMLDQLEWMALAMRNHRDRHGLPGNK